MKKFNYKSRKGFTLIELLVVIGILAVLAAIAIPSVAGLIDKANVSADKTNSNEMTNAMERFASEYELFCQDIASGTFDKDNMDAAQGRVYSVLGIEDRAGIELVEIGADEVVNDDAIAIFRDTKYPANAKTAQLIVQNYTKTSSSTFEPKQSDMHYWYSPDCGVVVTATPEAERTKLNSLIVSGKDAKGNNLGDKTQWIDLTTAETLPTIISELVPMNWKGLTNFDGQHIWTDGISMYYSYNEEQYVLIGDTWVEKEWQNPIPDGIDVWTDNTNIFYCNMGKQYILQDGDWITHGQYGGGTLSKSFRGRNVINGAGRILFIDNGLAAELRYGTWVRLNIGTNAIYGSSSWVQDGKIYTSTNWGNGVLENNSWKSIVKYSWFSGTNVWTDGTTIYVSQGSNHQCIVNEGRVTSKIWTGFDNFYGKDVWTDGVNYYYSSGTNQYKFL